jgi:hypothetical protein
VLLRHARLSLALLTPVLVVALLAVLPAQPAQAAAFPDTAGTSFDRAVQALVDDGVIEGCGDGTNFCPGRSLTRAQLASLLVRALELPSSDGDHFRDVAGSVHEDNVNALAEAGITNGCTEDRFCPSDPITRAEMATMLARAFDPPATDVAYFDDTGGTHADAIDRIAAAGITAGCGRPATAFCPQEPVQRQQTALFLARALGHVDRVQVTSLEERRAEEERRRRLTEQAHRDRIWDDLAQCESGGNWSINTGNGFYGGLQFSLQSWRGVGGSGYPHQHSREEQIHRGERLLAKQGWGAWPSCSRQLGYR